MITGRHEFNAKLYLEWLLEMKAFPYTATERERLKDFFHRGLMFEEYDPKTEPEFFKWLEKRDPRRNYGSSATNEAGA